MTQAQAINVMKEAHGLAKSWGSENGAYAARLKEAIKTVWAMIKEAAKYDEALQVVTGAVKMAFSFTNKNTKGENKMTKIEQAVKNGILTQNEGDVMDWLMTEGYYAEYNYSDITVKDIAENIGQSVNSVRGYVGSLVKKGYLIVEEYGMYIVYATDKGYELAEDFETNWKPQMWHLNK